MSDRDAFLRDTAKVTAVVVTYNRKKLLLCCLEALVGQSCPPERIVVVDNASVDGTPDDLDASGWMDRKNFSYVRLHDNRGGAGGFEAGIRAAIELGGNWIWLMDDDAAPKADALEELTRIATDKNTIYGSAAVQGDKLSWRMTPIQDRSREIADVADLPDSVEVVLLPFLGFLVHRCVISTIGFPDGGYFIAADDVEYCLRARQHGIKTVLAGRSRIDHPAANLYDVHLFKHKFVCLKLPPWKRYYDTRNRLLLAKTHFGVRLYTQTLPGLMVRLSMTMIKEPDRAAQFGAFMAGVVDGLLGVKGRRHEFWRISPK